MQDQSQIKVTVGIQQCRVHLPKAGVLIIKERIYLTQKKRGDNILQGSSQSSQRERQKVCRDTE